MTTVSVLSFFAIADASLAQTPNPAISRNFTPDATADIAPDTVAAILDSTIIDDGKTVVISSRVESDNPSPWDTEKTLVVGDKNTGTLHILDGAVVTTGAVANIGSQNGSVGTVLVTGEKSVWDSGPLLNVGEQGQGILTIADGAKVSTSIQTTIGYFNSENESQVKVEGKNSTWETGTDLSVGLYGKARLTVSNGALVSNAGSSVIGEERTGLGTAMVTGAGSRWITTDHLNVGVAGTGALTIKNGGSVSNGAFSQIGNFIGSSGTVLVSGTDSKWEVGSNICVGGSGTGTLTIENGGSVTNSGSQIGAHPGGEGTVLVTGSGSSWRSGSNIAVGSTGNGMLTLGNDGAIYAPSITIAEQEHSTGTLNIGTGGVLQTNSITFGKGTGTLNFDTVGDNVFSPIISGNGTLNVLSGKTILTGDSSSFTGTAAVSANSDLAVDGVLGGSIDVLRGGFLGGVGVVGSTTIEADGTLAPGNSIGTIHVNGDLTFKPGAIYSVEVDPFGNNDKTAIAGAATLTGASVNVIASAGDWKPETRYTILSATGGLNGTAFQSVSSNFQFLDPTLGYDANNVTLTLTRNDLGFSSLGKTPNQKRALKAIEGLAKSDTGNPLVQRMLGLDKATAPITIAQLPGEIHASLIGALLDDSRFIDETVTNRLRSAFDVVAAAPFPVLAYGPDGAEEQPATTDRFAVWGQGFGSWATKKDNDSVPGIDRSTGGFLIGGDAAIVDNTRLGVVAGYSHTSLDETGLDATASVDSVHLGLYGGAEFGAVNLRSGAAYTWHDISTERLVQFTGTQENLGADYNAGTAQVFAELGYKTKLASVELEPFTNLAYANLHTDAFTENGGTAALSGAAMSNDMTSSTLGLHALTAWSLGSADATLRGTIGWRHAYGDTTPATLLAFAGSDAFDVSGLPIARNTALLEVGFGVELTPGMTFDLSYRGEVASKVQDHGLKADFGIKF
ncbi:autotransporter domain-containing protein [Phyllobacterium sp. LjRoot231]|uniref:autotransporter family protein n=1 Tax=Phyllobacterium sp. LjRoot231 TaxID=3342289 RepID=UPI003ECD1763